MNRLSRLRLRPAIGSWPGGLVVRRVTADDLRTLDAVLPQELNIGDPIGYAVERDGDLLGAGSVSWDSEGRAWGWLNRCGCVPAVTLHRCALEMLRMLRDVEEPALYMICDASNPAAVRWARRLGFVPDDTLTHPFGPVMRCDLTLS